MRLLAFLLLYRYDSEARCDSTFQFPALFNGFKSAFQTAEGGNMNVLAQALRDTSTFPNPSTLINFLANHDLPRFRSVVASDSIAFNAWLLNSCSPASRSHTMVSFGEWPKGSLVPYCTDWHTSSFHPCPRRGARDHNRSRRSR